MTEADQLHPVLLHHIVNTLGWTDLRPMQRAAVTPLLTGDDALVLAPTAGGKTEAAMFPLLSRMANERWTGTSILYVCPLKALLNNLVPRLERYTEWLGRRAAVWHGDITAPRRKAILAARPDVLLTTPESLEAMLVSQNVDHRSFFTGLRAVVVDEVHAFAGDDRGWHLLAVLERLTHLLGRPIQRVGLSATVGNPDELLTWLQGSGRDARPSRIIAPEQTVAASGPPPGHIELDYVGSLQNAAKVIATLHGGEKRLVFCESRQTVEELGQMLRERGVTTFLSHASLSADERRRSEQAFAEARDCVIVSTSTLELGIDVGDLDRVIQIDAPTTVASFLQRLGRTGRRAGTTRNCLFLTRDGEALTKAAALLLLWGRGWVEPVVPPPEPRHIIAQQVLALCLQEHRVGDRLWAEWWNGLAPFDQGAEPIVRYLSGQGYLESDGGLLFIGPEAEKRFGYRHFMGMTAVFTGPPEFAVLLGRADLGRVDPSLLTEEVQGDRRLLLNGRSWRVTYIDWQRRRCFVEPADGGGRARWTTGGWAGLGFELTRAIREVMLGSDPPVRLTARAIARLAKERDEKADLVHPGGNVIIQDRQGDLRWWTWAGFRANATLAATLGEVIDPAQRFDDCQVRLRRDLTPAEWRALTADAGDRLCLPDVDKRALDGLKFSAALPERLAVATLAARLADLDGAATVLAEPARFVKQ
ncbi:DEAD/DEAH box helicase [Actinoplanes xinjiangensis]|uniref:ATP-dependent Lhr-like helicase n=1 Tax=Actinoplanes xinjiangensis TaxID=512350 RepID=A0A316FMW0_9ACTN|nr:DEAD/DEAH box helicase [Actinoplanes xinjiangensis]PWK49462.1 ATP-dependent Lhr-like helicase [Actinoplanes xinjiangensis]GIF37466.1 ATP-dependent helicase [Actinoplanes xinjiangensis]